MLVRFITITMICSYYFWFVVSLSIYLFQQTLLIIVYWFLLFLLFCLFVGGGVRLSTPALPNKPHSILPSVKGPRLDRSAPVGGALHPVATASRRATVSTALLRANGKRQGAARLALTLA